MIPSGSSISSLAIDGNQTSCSRTQGRTVLFQIDLMQESIVSGILLTIGGMLFNYVVLNRSYKELFV